MGVAKVNILAVELDERLDEAGFRHVAASVGERLGAAVYQAEPGVPIWPYHYHHGIEEWLYVISGAPVLREPAGERTLAPGDVVCFPTGPVGAHTVKGPGRFAIFGTGQQAGPGLSVYPDSDKVSGPEGILRRSSAVGDWHGEGTAGARPPDEPAPAAERPSPRPVANVAAGSSPLLEADRFEVTGTHLGPDSEPYHCVNGREEWLLVLAGTPTLRHPHGEEGLATGDLLCFPEGPAGARHLTGGRLLRLIGSDSLHCVKIDRRVSGMSRAMPSSLVAPLLASALAFGPADPVPPRTATCFDAAAGTIAVGRETSRGWVVETSTADGPWQRVIGPLKGRLCPVLAAAPDGTAVVAAGSEPARVATRPPGGTFGTATRLPGGRTSRLAAAAAPGGHVAVLWAPREPKTRKLALRALVAAPGRPTAQAVITRSGSVEQPALVIGPDGVATAGWTALHPLRKRTSEFRGGRWSTPVNVATSNEFSETSGVSLAVAPNGRRLMAWEADDGVRVQVDGEPATVVAPKPDFTSAIVGALADDGSAILTFIADDGPMLGVDRAPGGAWSPPHALPLGDGLPDTSFTDDLLGQRIDLAPGGQATVTWRLENGRIAAVIGQAGGAWEATGSLLSSPVRFASTPRFTGGRIVWLEPDGFDRPGALRGARLGASLLTDTTAPEFTARAAGRIAPQKPGPITVPLRAATSRSTSPSPTAPATRRAGRSPSASSAADAPDGRS